jgi:hypothetical protein
MAFVEINPVYQHLLACRGLSTADDLLALPGVVVSGHPDRHVLKVKLGAGPAALGAFLKKEHRVAWKERLANVCTGLGLVSKSYREAVMLGELRRAGLDCPEWLAAGEDSAGRAFILIREVDGGRDLRAFLGDGSNAAPGRRRALARQLGQAVARLHAAGFDHPDLYSKHFLVRADGSIALLDCQRCRRRRVTWRQRTRALAKLNASVADELAGARDRLACLRAYLRASLPAAGGDVGRAARTIMRETARLLRRPRLREMRRPLLPDGRQDLVWLDGEALCVTRAFQAECQGMIPHRLRPPSHRSPTGGRISGWRVALPRGGSGLLVRRATSRPLAWLWGRLWRRRLVAPEVAQAATLFRLNRVGIETATLLAFGQRHGRPWQTDSFLLTARPAGSQRLVAWLQDREPAAPAPSASRSRRHVVRETAVLLRRLHEAGYNLVLSVPSAGLIVGPPADRPVVLVRDPACVERRRLTSARRERDLLVLARGLRAGGCGRTDLVRFYLAYLGRPRLGRDAKLWMPSRVARELTRPRAAPASMRGAAGTEEPVHEPGLLLPERAAGARRL